MDEHEIVHSFAADIKDGGSIKFALMSKKSDGIDEIGDAIEWRQFIMTRMNRIDGDIRFG